MVKGKFQVPRSKIQIPRIALYELRMGELRIWGRVLISDIWVLVFGFWYLVCGFWSLVFGIWSLVFSKGDDWFIYQTKKNAVSLRQIIYLCKLKIIYESLKM